MRILSLPVACLAALLFASSAVALPAGSPQLLGFGATYTTADGGSATHRGVDVACAAGDEVQAPAEGSVTFVGRVPASSGGSMLAISVQTDTGTVTLMPMRMVSVAEGERVGSGDPLGTAEGEGDASSSRPHLHVGLKSGGLYLDPSPLIGAVPLPEPTSGDPVTTAEPAPGDDACSDADQGTALTPMPGVAIAPATGVVAEPQAPPSAAGLPVQIPEPVSGGSSAARSTAAKPSASTPARTSLDRVAKGSSSSPVTVVGGSSAPVAGSAGAGVALAAAPEGSSGSSRGSVLGAMAGGMSTSGDIDGSASGAAMRGRIRDALGACSPAAALTPAGIASVLGALCVTALLFSRRVLSRRILECPPVSDRLGYLLQHLKAGDTLRGLTSCPGPLPSQSRGRIAQGR